MGGEGDPRARRGRAVAGARAERGDGGAHPALGGGVGEGEAVLVLRRAGRREAAARLHRRACAPVEVARQARRRAVRPHDDAHRRQDVQGVPGRLPGHPAAARQGVFERHGAHRQGVPRRGRGAARHQGRAGGRRLGVHAPLAVALGASRTTARSAAWTCWCCRRARRSSTASSNAPTARCASSAGASTGTTSPAPR